MTISAIGANTQFAFGADTSGTLAALGINTFFTGSQAGSIGINNTVLQDPTKFAASSKGVGTDTTNAQTLAGFLTLPLASQNGATIQTLYNNMTTGVTPDPRPTPRRRPTPPTPCNRRFPARKRPPAA